MAHKSQELKEPKIEERKPLINTRKRAGQSAFERTQEHIAEVESKREQADAQTPRGFEATASEESSFHRGNPFTQHAYISALHKAIARHHRYLSDRHRGLAAKAEADGNLRDAEFHRAESRYHHFREVAEDARAAKHTVQALLFAETMQDTPDMDRFVTADEDVRRRFGEYSELNPGRVVSEIIGILTQDHNQ